MSARSRAVAGAAVLTLSVPLSLADGGSARAAGLLPLGCTPAPTLGLKPIVGAATLAIASVHLHADDLTPTVGERHEITARIDANRLEGACLVFTKISGPGSGTWPLVRTTDSAGSATVTLGSPEQGPEVLAVVALGGTGQTLAGGTLTIAWGSAAPVVPVAPPASPAASPTPRPTAPVVVPPTVVPHVVVPRVVLPHVVGPRVVAPRVVAPHQHQPAQKPTAHVLGGPVTVTSGPAPQRALVVDPAPLAVLYAPVPSLVTASSATSTGAIATAGAVVLFVLLLGGLVLWHGPTAGRRTATS